MNRYRIANTILAAMLLTSVAMAVPSESAQDAAKIFAEGRAALATADFDAALDAFRTAAKGDRSNDDYRQQYAMLRRIIKMRGQIESEENDQKWLPMAHALRTYYHVNGIYKESLPLDVKIHEKDPGAASAALLAETQLDLSMNSEVIETLAGLDKKEATPRTRILLGIAHARQGQIDDAKKLAKKAKVKKDAGARVFGELARLRALTGNSKKAIKALTRSFELTPGTQLDAAKAEAKACPDFSSIVDTASFAKALETQSKVKESKCSKGTGCGKCPKRGGCAKETPCDTKKKD